jgi:uncharacterized protein (DUF58 family)
MNEEILKKVKRIEITTKKLMDEFMSGGYKSHFKGQGVQFSEHRTYTPGDDIRHIDWKVSARSKEPLLKQYEEERELSVFIIADFSASQEFGSQNLSKKELVTQLGSMIAYAANLSGDKIGVLFVTNKVKKTIIPKKGKNHVLRIIHDFLNFSTEPGGTDLKGAFEEARRVLKHSGIVFVISDFHAENYERNLKQLSRKNDVVAIRIQDPREQSLPFNGVFEIEHPETGKRVEINSGSSDFKKHTEEWITKFNSKSKQALEFSGVETLTINTNDDYTEALVHFFKRRKQKK